MYRLNRVKGRNGMTSTEQKLPIGIENFEKLRKENFYYIDKTGFIKELLLSWGEVNLFVRPGRFGKSLNMSRNIFRLVIPNLEIRNIFTRQIMEFFRENVRRDGASLNAFNRGSGMGYSDILE